MPSGTGHTSVRSYELYSEGLTSNANTFASGEIDFIDSGDATPFTSQGIILINDNAAMGADILFSFDGTSLHGRAKPGDTITFDFRRETKIFLKSSAASSYRLWAW